MTSQQVEAVLKGKLEQRLKQADLQNLGVKSASLIRKMIIDRILAGKDLYGNNFGSYSSNYDKAKAWAYAAAKYGTYKYSSSSESAKLRLTGRLLNRIIVKFEGYRKTGTGITYKYLITTGQDVKDQVEGLQSTTGVVRTKNGKQRYSKKAWYFLGISKELGEQDKLKNYLGQRLKMSGTIKTKNI